MIYVIYNYKIDRPREIIDDFPKRCLDIEFSYSKDIKMPDSICKLTYSGIATLAFLIDTIGEISDVHLTELFLQDSANNVEIIYSKRNLHDNGYPDYINPYVDYFRKYKDSVVIIITKPLNDTCSELNNFVTDDFIINNHFQNK